jgi:kinesin family protein 5
VGVCVSVRCLAIATGRGQESLGGNSRTSLVVNCSPALLNRDETMSTLRFGVRAKRMVNNPRANKERSAAELKLLLEQREQEIARLKKRVAVLEGAYLCGYGDWVRGLG